MTIGRFAILLLTAFMIYCTTVSLAQRSKIKVNTPDPTENRKKKWVDSVYRQLTMEERIGQLFMVAAYSGGKNYNEPKIRELINNHQIGGVIFMQGDPVSQALLTNQYQQAAQVPLLIGMDAEWGLGMRLTGVRDFPRAMLLGATRDSSLVYRMGAGVAAQCKRLGVHVNFAPVVDVNNNPNNPIINARSFGEDKRLVTRLGAAYMNGLQQNGVMACAKHFPGHGDTETDSHLDLPTITKSVKQLDTLELYPFRRLVNAGIKSVMVAHLYVPALDSAGQTPTTLSQPVITGLLRQKMGFKGLVFTDALDMKGVAKYYQPGELDLKAFTAGNNVLLFSQDVPVAIAKIRAAIDSGMVREQLLEESVKKILTAKYEAGLNRFRPIDTTNIVADLNRAIAPIREEAFTKGISLIRDEQSLIGRIEASGARVSYIGVNASQTTPLYEALRSRVPELRFDFLPKGSTQKDLQRIREGIPFNDVTIVAVHNMTFYPSGGDYGLDARQMELLKGLDTARNVLYVLMGNPYLMKHFCNAGSVLVAYEDDSIAQSVMADILLRDRSARGRLPVTPCPGLVQDPVEEPVVADATQKGKEVYELKHVDFKEDAGVVNPKALEKLNMFLQKSVVGGAFPGCRVIASKNGKIFYDEAFGYYDYTKQKGVELFTMYDIASMTKVLSTTIAVMKLYDQGKLDINQTLGNYLKWTRGSDKANILIKDLLLHQAGLKSWIPFYKETLDEQGNLKGALYSREQTKTHSVSVAKNLWLRNDYPDTIWKRILESPLERGKYVYSDLDFYFLAAVVEQITGKPINEYVESTFYKPMGLKRIGYLPLKKFKLADITPTENDMAFRKQVVHGYVHDPGAALFGGVAGHAGLFAQAEDAAAIFQMLLNGGTYRGKRYFKKATVDRFTSYNTRISRRGLGFDKPSADRNDGGPAGNRVSGHAFGHQGFTGTAGWADPATGVVFIFLSNRVFPSAENNNINRLSVRTVAQDYIYEALGIPVNRSRQELHRQQVK